MNNQTANNLRGHVYKMLRWEMSIEDKQDITQAVMVKCIERDNHRYSNKYLRYLIIDELRVMNKYRVKFDSIEELLEVLEDDSEGRLRAKDLPVEKQAVGNLRANDLLNALSPCLRRQMRKKVEGYPINRIYAHRARQALSAGY